ncbi:hypothetical protein GGS23DRAFT_24696 [Durotheca rogersii]|uniref:uncharacterized protein n=1 Tax=Durotheca rogersii TaxID=419775 RepID=UPI00221FC256|nr:uncharacterized protein GGS23DRAFT_24696 [Durotheca rogersii]KAI5868366.1 hypothetical protein GGS23DRAFT_24696 [Durotheca rogersii]
MPTYLCHGFRWHRRSIRYFVVLRNVDDAAPEWIVARRSSIALLDQFYELFDFLPPSTRPAHNPSPSPSRVHGAVYANSDRAHTQRYYPSHEGYEHEEKNDRYGNSRPGNNHRDRPRKRSNSLGRLFATENRDTTTSIPSSLAPSSPGNDVPFNDWSVVKFVEEFDPSDLSVVSGPWAYVADYVVRIDTSVSVAEEIGRYEERTKTERYKPMSGPSDESGLKVNTFGSKKAGWFEQLRDQLQRSESIRWYVVVCGDEERADPRTEGRETEESVAETSGGKNGSRSWEDQPLSPSQEPYPVRGFVENGFEFRLPEFLEPQRPREPRARRRQGAENKRTNESLATSPTNDQPISPSQAAYRIPAADDTSNLKSPKSPKSTSGLRRLFLRRQTGDSTQNAYPGPS